LGASEVRSGATGRPVEDGAAALGERLRQLRVGAGLTQTDLAGGRFSKEYVSQIERGKTRPTPESIGWLAERLGVDAGFLAIGMSAAARDRLEAGLARAEALSEAHRYAEAIPEFQRIRPDLHVPVATDLELRALAGLAWVLLAEGRLDEGGELLKEARSLAEGSDFGDLERADVLFRLGVYRYKLSSISTAIALFDEALALVDRSELPSDLLRSNILGWRSRCYHRQRDWQAAREDVERALELAEHLRDPRATADAHFLASAIAEREGHWILARSYAERARALYEELSDRENIGRLLNNLGGLTYLLGKPAEAVEYLKDAFRVALELGNDVDAGQSANSLAEVQIGIGEYAQAETNARHALDLLADQVDADYLFELGTAQLTLGRAVLEQDRLDEAEGILRAADRSFEQLTSTSHRAAVWVAMGDLAAKRGDDRESARLYRRAAETLQDFRF
jgi:tetratricopeptide (TPR) repeat protein